MQPSQYVRVCVCVHVRYIYILHFYNVSLVCKKKKLCEQQEFVMSNKIFHVDSFPFFSGEFLRIFPQLFQTLESPECWFFPSHCCFLPLCHSTGRDRQAIPGVLFVD